MTSFASMAELRAACLDLPKGHAAALEAVARREAQLTKPPGSLGRLESVVGWLAHWQGRVPPRLDRVDILVFAGNHGVTAQGVSAYPAEVTAQMVANFAAGGAAINQLAGTAGASLRVVPLSLERPTADFTLAPAMDEQAFLAAVAAGADTVSPDADLVCLGEMGIGNTTAASAIAAALYGGGGSRWAGQGTGVNPAGLVRKRAVIDAAPARATPRCSTTCSRWRPRSAGASLPRSWAPRSKHGGGAFRSCSMVSWRPPAGGAAPPVRPDALGHALAGHVSAEAGHRILLDALGLAPLLDLKMRLGECSGAAVAVLLLRAALLAASTAWRRFAEAQVAN